MLQGISALSNSLQVLAGQVNTANAAVIGSSISTLAGSITQQINAVKDSQTAGLQKLQALVIEGNRENVRVVDDMKVALADQAAAQSDAASPIARAAAVDAGRGAAAPAVTAFFTPAAPAPTPAPAPPLAGATAGAGATAAARGQATTPTAQR